MDSLHVISDTCTFGVVLVILSPTLFFIFYLQNLGQKTFGHVKCGECGMLLTCGHHGNQMVHYNYHMKLKSRMEFRVRLWVLVLVNSLSLSLSLSPPPSLPPSSPLSQGWKNERVVNRLPNGL